jgi:hypothetical protein
MSTVVNMVITMCMSDIFAAFAAYASSTISVFSADQNTNSGSNWTTSS